MPAAGAPRLVDASGAEPARLYVTVDGPEDAAVLAAYVRALTTGPFTFDLFGRGGKYGSRALKHDLARAGIALMPSDKLGTTNQQAMTVVWRRVRSDGAVKLAVRVNGGTLVR
jgi:hypothetical protein